MVKPSQEDDFFCMVMPWIFSFEILSPFPYIKTLLEVSDHVLKKKADMSQQP